MTWAPTGSPPFQGDPAPVRPRYHQRHHMVFIPAITAFAISRLLGGSKFMLYGDLIENQFITLGRDAWPVGSALSFILLVLVLISMAIMRRAEREAGEEGGMLW